MKTVYLYGSLAERFGDSYTLDIQTPREAVLALATQLPGFGQVIRDGKWHIVRGPLEHRDEVTEEGVDVSLGNQDEIHIIPAVEGATNGWVNVILGATLMVAAAFGGPAAPYLFASGVGLMVGGIIQLTMKFPDPKTRNRNESFLLNGPTNHSNQGVAVPRGYGRCRVGSIVISSGLYAEKA